MTRTKLLGLLLVAIMIVGGVATAAPADDLNFGDDSDVPNPYIDVDTMTVAKHPMDKGTSVAAIEGYFDDNGDWVDDPEWVVNTTQDVSVQSTMNRYTFDPAYIEDPDFGAFPRTGDNGDASALDASEYTTDESNSGGTISVSDTAIASGVEAVSISTSSQSTAGNYLLADYSNWTSELDSDESKRVLQVAGEVNSIDAGARVSVRLEDESGDYKEIILEPDASGQDVNASVFATGTGTFFYQVKLSALSTNGGGSWDNIETVRVRVDDANADVDFSNIDLAKKTKTSLGQKAVVDSDGDYTERNTTYNATGTVSITDLSTMDSEFDDASITDLQFAAKYPASSLNGVEGTEDAYRFSWDDAGEYVGYDTILNVSYRLSTTGAIDLSHSGLALQWEQNKPSGRYITAGHEEGIGESGNLTALSLTSATLGSAGDTITHDSSVSTGTYYGVKYEVKLTSEEANAIKATGGAAAPPADSGSGGVVGFLTSLPGMLIMAGGAILGYLRFWK